jgi:hypothetical protein
MRTILLFILCLYALASAAQIKPAVQPPQKLNTFYLVDSATRKGMAVSVAIVRANLFITTEPDGVFVIPGDLTKMRDTIIFSAQNYQSIKFPLNLLNGLSVISLKKDIVQKSILNASFKNDTLLNDFERDEVAYHAGVTTEHERFDYKQIAQKFTLQKSGVSLKAVKVIRLAYAWRDGLHAAKYRLRVYDADPKTGAPGKDLCAEQIEVSSANDQKQNNINLKKYGIIIPNKTFYIAVEWLRDNYNAAEVVIYDRKQKKMITYENYQPAIGLSPIKGNDLNIWALTIKNEWKPYTYFMPFGTDLAIKATIEY